MSLALGPFVLDARIGSGGMAEVWRAHHVDDDVPVAVKVLTGERARRPRSVSQFRQEARAVARLDHPHVVGIHDFGLVPPEVSDGTRSELEIGAPYLVMDLLPGGSLWKYRGRLKWPDLRNLLRVLLDALAHAHARGVIHRDLKPSNVLLSHERRAVISDFGLAHLEGPDAVHMRAGTPAYMAPEQFQDQWRDFGPWTDLYGFGCLVWAMCAGSAPFRGANWEETRQLHLHAKLPALATLQPVPEGFEGWLVGLLRKDPARRTQCAADALFALDQLPDSPTEDEDLPVVEPDTTLDTRPEPTTMRFLRAAVHRHASEPVGRNDAPPPPPDDWRGPTSLRRLHLRGSGLGLLGARALPTVGRESERDQLWREVVAVHKVPVARAVVLEGAAGTGKSHLARWLAQRAHELGAAHTLQVEHTSRSGAEAGLAGMLRVHFGTQQLPEPEVPDRVATVARSWGTSERTDLRVLAETALDASDAPFAAIPQRIGALSRHLCAVGARRPVILLVDDAQRGIDALLFVRWLLRRRDAEPAPVLAVLVVQDEGLARHPSARGLINEIVGMEGVTRVRVPSLPDDDQLRLVRELVGLEGELARRVAARTGGNPAFAVALVEDWVSRGILVQSEGGFRLQEGSESELPDDLYALWQAHLKQALGGFSEAVWRALEVGAALGLRVQTSEWRRICRRAGAEASPEAVESLMARRLVVSSDPDEAWRFVHAMVRESLLRRAAEGGRLVGIHQRVLEDLSLRRHADDQRMARHLLGAGRTAEAVTRMMQAARSLFGSGNAPGALDLCDQAERACLDEGLEQVRRWRPAIAIQRARCLVLLGRLDEAEASANLVASDDQAASVEKLEAAIIVATLGILRGNLERSRDQLQALAELSGRQGHDRERARSLRSLGIALHQLGDQPASIRASQEGRAAASSVGDWATWVECTLQLAASLAELEHFDEARQVADEALAARDRIPHPSAVAGLLNLRAEIERRQGRHDTAVPLYEEAAALLDRMGSLEASIPRLNLATIHVIEGRFGEAWRLAERCRRESALQGRPPLEMSVRAVLLLAAIGLEDRIAAEAQVVRLAELHTAGVTSEPDTYSLLGLGSKMLADRGEPETANVLRAMIEDWLRTRQSGG
jgi:serine/threonine protein kinase/tetratricopeptide (TPR) repeat protein